MNKKPLAAIRLHTLGRYTVMASLTLGLGQHAMAQAVSNSWNFTFSFNGSGTLPVSKTSYGVGHTLSDDPTLTLSMSGAGIETAVSDMAPDPSIFGGYYVNSSFSATASISQPNMVSPSSSPYNPTTSSTINYTTPEQHDFPVGGSAPFFFLYPPLDGTQYSANPAAGNVESFQYDPSTVLTVQFNGETNEVILGTDVSETQSGNVVTDTFANSEVLMSADIGENDPLVVFTGDIILTTTVAGATAPDSSTGWIGALAILGVCAAGALNKKSRTA